MTKLFDITSVSAAETGTLELLRPDGSPLYDGERNRCSITLYGPGTSQYQAAAAARQNRALDKMRRKGKLDQSAEEKLAEEARFLTAITVSFNNFTYPGADGNGQALFRAVYEDPKLGFIKDQAAEFAGDWENFTGGSATS